MEAPNKPQWYGAAIANATNFSRDIPWQGGDGGGREGEQGFPQWLRDVMEPHIEKCRRKRADAVETASEEARRRPWWGEWDTDSFPTERNVAWETAGHDLRGAFCEATGCGIELERVHEVMRFSFSGPRVVCLGQCCDPASGSAILSRRPCRCSLESGCAQVAVMAAVLWVRCRSWVLAVSSVD